MGEELDIKVRYGFVSNSSSASFVIAKAYMTDEQVSKFSNFIDFLDECRDEDEGILEYATGDGYSKYIDKYGISFCEGSTPHESKHYFMGTVDQSMIEPIHKFLKDIGIDEEYYDFGD